MKHRSNAGKSLPPRNAPALKVIEGLKGRYEGALEKAGAAAVLPDPEPETRNPKPPSLWGGNPFGYLGRNA